MTMGFYVPTNNDVKFPKACEHCHFYDGLLCCVLDTYIHDPENKQEDCPLVPVPPHVDLIDRNALAISTAVPLDGKPYRYVHIDNIENASTIIPADEPKEE